MCQSASAYPLEVLKEMDRVDGLLTTPTAERVLSPTTEFNQIAQQPVALIQATDSQLKIITQEPLAQLGRLLIWRTVQTILQGGDGQLQTIIVL